MKKNLNFFSLAAMSIFVGFISCQDDLPEETNHIDQANENQIEKPFKTGVMLSYRLKETAYSTVEGKSEPKLMAGRSINTEEKEVSIYFDENRENYQILTRRLDKPRGHDKDFIEPQWREKVEANHFTARYNNGGEVISMLVSMEKGSNDLSYMVTPYPERSKMMKEMLSNLNNGSKSNTFEVEFQSDTNVVRISRYYQSDEEFGKEMDGFTAISYVNVKYGVPVVSELYDPSGKLTSKVTLLYKMIDDIPVVAYEEAISYTKDFEGEVVEHKTITNYENLNITNF